MALTKSQTQLLLIMSIALVSLGSAYLLFYFTNNSQVWGTTNHGEFVEPHTTTAQLGWVAYEPDEESPTNRSNSPNGSAINVPGAGAGSEGKWWLWTVAERCEEVCKQKLKDVTAAHILLNREADRVERGITLRSDENLGLSLASEFKMQQVSVEKFAGLNDGVYIVDPNGNLVFVYPIDAPPKHILEDLKRLLKVSQIG